MLQRTERAIVQRAADLVQQAESFIRGGYHEKAAALLEEARQLKPDADGLASTTASLAEARQEKRRLDRQAAATGRETQQGDEPATAVAKSPATVKGARGELTEKEEKELAELYQRGMAAMDAGHSGEALRYWELVWAIKPDYLQVQEHLKTEYITRGMELFASRDLREAVRMWEDAARIDPSDERTIDYLNRAREQMSRAQAIRDTRH
jgi:tetratricopeptide (TPR) repeat protein